MKATHSQTPSHCHPQLAVAPLSASRGSLPGSPLQGTHPPLAPNGNSMNDDPDPTPDDDSASLRGWDPAWETAT